ncbi:SdrD B-like domain-containing protein, partial [Spirosoma sp. 48-14]|uniref:SdrD B-like domain-containing protein n=1 Tax=Spirosoma sp. 48-14 TaxID=1895854 RepID=UPI000A4DFE21
GSTSAPVIVAQVNSTSCGLANGSASVQVTSGSGSYTYQWTTSTGTVVGTTAGISNLSAGTYMVSVVDVNGCSSMTSVVVGNSTPLNVTATAQNAVCGQATGSVSAQVSGGSPAYSYQWRNAAGSVVATSQNLTNASPGSYTVIVTDATGCTALASANISNLSGPQVSGVPTNVKCYGTQTGGVVLSVTGGTPPIGYQWSNGATTKDLSNVGAGVYTVTARDANGCVAVQSFTITQPTEIAAVFQPTYPTCTNPSGGSLSLVSISGGTSPYSYTWSTGAMTASINGLSGGTYTLTIKDALGCIASPLAVLPTPTGCSGFDLALTKKLATGQSSTVVAGGTVTFTIAVINQGGVDATNVQVTDYIPTGLTLNDANWTASGSKATLNSVIASLPAGQTTTRNITFTVSPTFVGSLTNVAEISSASNPQNLPDKDSNPDNDPTNDGTPVNDDTSGDHKNNPSQDEDDSDPEIITVVPTPVFDLALVKKLASGQSATVVAGSSVTFTITVYNQGNVDATNVQVTDYIPTGLTLNDASWTASGSLATLNSVIASLPAGQSTTRNITFTVSSNFAGGSITNVAEISSASNAQNLPDKDSDPDNNPTNDGTPVNDDTSGDHKNNPSQDEDDSDPEIITVTPLKAALGDYVWYDNNKNGQQDANEPPAVGVTVTLYNATTNQPISTTVTDATGHYLFPNLDPGTYYVVFTAPSGATFTTPNTGNDATDSDAGVGGRTGNYTLVAGQVDLTVDAGLIPQCTSPNCTTIITVK